MRFSPNIVMAAALVLLTAPACAADPQQQKQTAGTQIFDLPEGARVHDVAPAPGGAIWYTAQRQGALGILDPRTGKARQIPLGAGSAPHGVIQGPDGAAWITDSGLNAIIRFEPRTEKLTTWKLPADAGYANLNTGAFDGNGTYWFTGQNGIYGRLDPKTGKMDLYKDPEGRGPYGIAATPSGEVYYVSLAGSHLARIDRASGKAEIIEPPTKDQGARRVWADSKGNLWVSEWNSGNLSRYTPSSGAWKGWKLPGDKPKAYAVYVDERDMVWVSDFGANATLKFDPASEKWTVIPGSGEGANVRQILGRPGEVYLPESGTNRIMVVRTGAAA
jgi:virginiamycin B lyase